MLHRKRDDDAIVVVLKGDSVSEARFVAIEERLTSVENKVDALHGELRDTAALLRGEMRETANQLRGEIRESAETLRGEIRESAETLRGEIRESAETLRGEIRQSAETLRSEFQESAETLRVEMHAEMHAFAGSLRHEMRVLHEDTIANIKALAPDFAPIRREFQEADARLRDDVERRLTPLEAAMRARRKPRRPE
ncbi:MAG TPA: hypothetical protein VFO19_11585 [Vicinamibacterales bacterium]|nr:hypothetical protein [Vicinamibacterales bacterium]